MNNQSSIPRGAGIQWVRKSALSGARRAHRLGHITYEDRVAAIQSIVKDARAGGKL